MKHKSVQTETLGWSFLLCGLRRERKNWVTEGRSKNLILLVLKKKDTISFSPHIQQYLGLYSLFSAPHSRLTEATISKGTCHLPDHSNPGQPGEEELRANGSWIKAI